ncbi:MAG: RHS repeat-associated core domain-containing protein, partial [Prevotella sp.]|nr:RHS repeat-associated core domain-containing protein [Prevotella sp.]
EEKVTYSYNLGGLLEKVRGEKSYGYDYITKLGYDKFEQRSYLKYCNGAETFYTYDDRRRLSNLAVNSGNTTIMDNDYTFDAVSNVLSVANNASLPASGNAGGRMSHAYTYDGLYRLVSATGTYTGADSKSASYTLAMDYDNMHRITSKSQHLTQDNVQFNGTLNVGYDLSYTYGTENGKKFQLASVKDVNYRTEETPGDNNIENNHVYLYDKNGNLVYVNTGRMMKDGHNEVGTRERKLIWDEENRLLAVDDNGFVSNYWYDADGERTVKTSGESDQVYVNGVFSGGSTNTAKFSLYVSPYLVANQGGRYTKHIYAGSQRIVSKVGDFASYGSDPRRIEYAGANTDGLSVNYKAKYAAQQQVIKDNYKTFDVPYNGTDNDNYADGEGFCCNDGSMEAAVAQARKAQAHAVAKSFKDPDNYENLQFFYHPDHLGSSSYITNLDGEVVQHIEYVPFGEVFIEERNNVWNTPYLFNAKEFDEETGMYYYGARYYEPRLSLWMSCDPMQEKYSNISSYCYVLNNPIKFIDIAGLEIGSPWKYIAPVIPKNKFVGWGNSPFYQNFLKKNGRQPQCADYAKEQLRVVGVQVGGGSDPTNMYVYSEKNGANKAVLDKAIKYIKSELENGRPVFIGVDDAPNQKINEGTTDHFLVIVGMGHDKKGNYFQVYDNASGNVQDGANNSNRLYHNEKKNIVEGRTNTSYSQNANPYKLSQVRKNKVKPQTKPKKK